MKPNKALLRTETHQRVAAIPEAAAGEAASQLAESLWTAGGLLRSVFTQGATLLGFMPLHDEVSPLPAMQMWLDRGGQLCVPISDWPTRTLQPGLVHTLDAAAFMRGPHSVREPRIAQPTPACDVTVVIVPGVAFDRSGGRLGRGAGFYDRFLASLPAACLTIGVCFETQIIPCVPREPHDHPVQHVVAA